MAATVPSLQGHVLPASSQATFSEKLNSQWHEKALWVFMAIVLAHWGEHLAQAYQIWVMGWPIPKANGILGLWYPWLIKSEGAALRLRTGDADRHLGAAQGIRRPQPTPGGWSRSGSSSGTTSSTCLLITQATIHHNLMGKPVPYSIIQFFIPRVQLHLFYNSIVFIPMVIAMYYHMFPPEGEAPAACSCSWYQDDENAEADCRA